MRTCVRTRMHSCVHACVRACGGALVLSSNESVSQLHSYI